MRLFPALAVFLVTAVFSQLANASQNPLSWQDLIDESAQSYEDPFRDLTYDQIDDLRTVLVQRGRLEEAVLPDDARDVAQAKLDEANARLADDGLDADWLIAQRWLVAERRERAATAVNLNLEGKTIAIGGFAIPAPPDADGTRIVYLVPERGMCSHTPPPNPNQMIRARLSGDWSPQMMHEPVRLTGTLMAEETQHLFRIVDGDVPMRASFVMDVAEV